MEEDWKLAFAGFSRSIWKLIAGTFPDIYPKHHSLGEIPVSFETSCTESHDYMWCNFSLFHLLPPPPPDFARAVAARPISYAAVLRMKPDSSSVLNSRSRPRQHHSGGLGTPDWPAFSSHPLSALSLLGSQEDYRSEGKTNGAVKPTVCLLLSESKIEKFCFGFVKVHTEHETQTHK